MGRLVKTVCPRDCPDTCGMLAYVEDGKIIRLRGDPEHPVTKGYLCEKGTRHLDILYHPDRLLHPLKREGEGFKQVSWKEALTDIAAHWKEIIRQEGGKGILYYRYLGNMGYLSANGYNRLWNKMNTSEVGYEICAMAGAAAIERTLGSLRGLQTDPDDLPHSKMFIAWGRNVKDTNLHGFDAAKKIHPFAVIDPWKNSTAETADIFVQPKPRTDSALAMAMAKIIMEEELFDEEFVQNHTSGFDRLAAALKKRSLDELSRVTTVDQKVIKELTYSYVENKPSVIQVGIGIQRNLNGGEIVSNICLLPILTGQIGKKGGGILYAPSYGDWSALGNIDHRELRTEEGYRWSMAQIGRALTDSDRIKSLFVYNSNFAITSPNQNLIKKGLSREDLFVVVHDIFLTDTAKHADYVLPACTFFETTDLFQSYWNYYVQLSPKVIEPLGESKPNFEVCKLLGQHMGYTAACFHQSEIDVLQEILAPVGWDLNELRKGAIIHRLKVKGQGYKQPLLRFRFFEPSFTKFQDEGYILLQSRSPLTLRTQWYNSPYIPKRFDSHKRIVHIHPDDAGREGVADGDWVKLENNRGECLMKVQVTDKVKEGCLHTYIGWWGEDINNLTTDELADLAGNSAFQSTHVRIAKLEKYMKIPEAPLPSS